MTTNKVYQDLFAGYPCKMREIEVLKHEYYDPYREQLRELIRAKVLMFDEVVIWWAGAAPSKP